MQFAAFCWDLRISPIFFFIEPRLRSSVRYVCGLRASALLLIPCGRTLYGTKRKPLWHYSISHLSELSHRSVPVYIALALFSRCDIIQHRAHRGFRTERCVERARTT